MKIRLHFRLQDNYRICFFAQTMPASNPQTHGLLDKLAEINEGELESTLILIRSGSFEVAGDRLRHLRLKFGKGESPRISVWLFLLEGLLQYFEDLDANAIDKLKRAQVLSKAFGIEDLNSASSAWLAYIHFNENNFEEMAKYLAVAIENANTQSLIALPRIALVLAISNQFLGKWTDSRTWYDIAHLYAVRARDRTSIGATIFNRVAIGLSRVRAEQALGHDVSASEIAWMNEASSSENFHRGLSITSLPELLIVCRANACMLEGRYEQAILHFQNLLDNNQAKQCRLTPDAIKLEICFCHFRLEKLDETIAHFDSIDFQTSESLDLDDKLVFQTKYAFLLGALHPSSSTHHQIHGALEQTTQRYNESLKNLDSALRPLTSQIGDLLTKINGAKSNPAC